MAGIFRKAALERFSSPEQTDIPPRFGAHAGPVLAGIAVLAVLCMALLAVCSPPRTIELSGGTLALPGGACTVSAPAQGTVGRVFAAPGARISAAMPLIELMPDGADACEIFSPCAGELFSIAEAGDECAARSPLAAITPADRLCAVFAVPVEQAAILMPGQKADLILAEEHHAASVISVDSVPSPQSALSRFFPQLSGPLCLAVLLPEDDLAPAPDALSVRAQILVR